MDDEMKAELRKTFEEEQAKAVAAMEEKGRDITSQAKAEVIVHAERVVADKIAFYEGMLKVTGLSAAALAAVLGFWGVNQWSGFVDALSNAVVERVAPSVSAMTTAQLESLRRQYLITVLSARLRQEGLTRLSDSEFETLVEALRSPDLSPREFQQVTELIAGASEWADSARARSALRSQAEVERTRWLASPDEDASRRLYAIVRALNSMERGPLPWWVEIVNSPKADDRLRLVAAQGADAAGLVSALTDAEKESLIGSLLTMESSEGRSLAAAIGPTSTGVERWVRANCAKGTGRPDECGASLLGALISEGGIPLAGDVAKGLMDSGVTLSCSNHGELSLHGTGAVEPEQRRMTVNLRDSIITTTLDFDQPATWAVVEFLEPALRGSCINITLESVPGFADEAILTSGSQSSHELQLLDERMDTHTTPMTGRFEATITIQTFGEWASDTG